MTQYQRNCTHLLHKLVHNGICIVTLREHMKHMHASRTRQQQNAMELYYTGVPTLTYDYDVLKFYNDNSTLVTGIVDETLGNVNNHIANMLHNDMLQYEYVLHFVTFTAILLALQCCDDYTCLCDDCDNSNDDDDDNNDDDNNDDDDNSNDDDNNDDDNDDNSNSNK